MIDENTKYMIMKNDKKEEPGVVKCARDKDIRAN